MSDTLTAVDEAQVQPDTPSTPPPAPPQTQTDTAGPEQPQADQAPPAPILETAFVVYMNPQGHWMVAADLHAAAEMQISRPPNVDDFFYGCSMVVKDIHVQETAATAVALQQQALTQMAENARQAAMTKSINDAVGIPGSGGALDLSQLGRNR
jgi:hypothetical protein